MWQVRNENETKNFNLFVLFKNSQVIKIKLVRVLYMEILTRVIVASLTIAHCRPLSLKN